MLNNIQLNVNPQTNPSVYALSRTNEAVKNRILADPIFAQKAAEYAEAERPQ